MSGIIDGAGLYGESNRKERQQLEISLQQLLPDQEEKQYHICKRAILRLWPDSRAVQSNHNTPGRIQAGRSYLLHSRSNGRKCGNIRKDRDGRSPVSVYQHRDKLLDVFIQFPTVALPEGRCA